VNFGSRPLWYLGHGEANPSALKFADYIPEPILAGECDLAITATSVPCADSSTICAPPPGHHRPAAQAHDPEQLSALIVIDLAHP
jgi:hypothetical protein